MSTFEAECPACGHHLRLPATYAGKTGKCPSCRQTIQLPEASGGPALARADEAPVTEDADPGGRDERPCPICGEKIKTAARKCRHCGEFLDPSARRRGPTTPTVVAPLVLRIWGIGIMALNVLFLGLNLLQFVAIGLMGVGRGGGAMLAGMGIGILIATVIYGVLIRLGWGLYKGQKSAVIGLCVLAALGLALAVFVATESAGGGAVVFTLLAVMYGPPVGVGFARWRELT